MQEWVALAQSAPQWVWALAALVGGWAILADDRASKAREAFEFVRALPRLVLIVLAGAGVGFGVGLTVPPSEFLSVAGGLIP